MKNKTDSAPSKTSASPKRQMFNDLIIQSPKRTPQDQERWDGFFPYYAGFPEGFARTLLESAKLPRNSTVFDPWNGSGTTTYAASQLGLTSRGFDLNPVMIVVARSRLLARSEADAVEAFARDLIRGLRADSRALDIRDPLLWWFAPATAAVIRSIERRIRQQLVGLRTATPEGVRLNKMASIAATFYVALFSVARSLAAPYRSSNPTWLRRPKGDDRLFVDRKTILKSFVASLDEMSLALVNSDRKARFEQAQSELFLADTTSMRLPEESVDMVLTSPPYCTRIDYSIATRIELAVLYPLIDVTVEELGRKMIGSTRVPNHNIVAAPSWGETCCAFLADLRAHTSKASSGYYYKTHLDYFEKMERSLFNISHSLRHGGKAVLVVQDSYYKDIHNDLPTITAEMAKSAGLNLRRRDDFHFKRSMVGIHKYARNYKRATGVTESVLCFEKTSKRTAIA